MNAEINIPGLDDINRQLAEIRELLERPKEPELITVKDAARLLHVTEQTIRAWAHDGSLPVANRIGKKMMFLRDDVQGRK